MKPKRENVEISSTTRNQQRVNNSKELSPWNALMKIKAEVDALRQEWILRKQKERQAFKALRLLGDQKRSDSRRSSTLKSTGPVMSLEESRRRGYRTPQEIAAENRAWQRSMGMQVESPAEKRSGVMTDNVFPIPGRRVIVSTSTSGNPPSTTVQTIVQSVTGYQKVLDLVLSVDGDHKRPNRHKFRVSRYDFGTGFSFAGDSRTNTQISGSQTVGFGLSATFTSQKNFVYNKMLSKMYEKIRGDVDLSVDAFQARQSGVMLNQRFQQGRNVFLKKAPIALQEIVKIASRMRRSNPRDWGSLWLEWTYGWKPLAGSIFGAAENMILASTNNGSGVSGHPIRESASEKGDSRTVVSVVEPGVLNTKEIDSVYQSRIQAFYALSTGGLNGVAGYTSLNPVSIAWELVPYSFVADWFVDIGGYLRNMESSLLYNSDFTGGFTTERSKERIVETTAGGHTDYSVSATGSAETKVFERKVLGSSPMPRAPTFNPKLGVSRLISAASLLSQQLHSLKHKR